MKIIDVACGDGNYCRAVYDRFEYGNIVGVDISQSQIDIAKQFTDSLVYPNIKYECMDGAALSNAYYEQFDIALAIWFFPYAEDKNKLQTFVKSVYNTMKPKSLLIAATCTAEDMTLVQNFPEYGIYFDFENKESKQGMVNIKLGEIGFDVCAFSYETYLDIFYKTGFNKIRFLTSSEYKGYTNENNRENEQDLFLKIFNDYWIKYHPLKVFVAEK
eukprot:189278_1